MPRYNPITGKLDYTRSSAGEAPANATFLTLSTNATLTNERVLTGTANQIIITDNGAGSTAVLSLPQNIHTGANPTFAGLTINGAITAEVTGASASVPGTFTVDSSVASQPALRAQNDTNFAHAGNIAHFRMLNGTDTGIVALIENEGTGKSLVINRASLEVASIDNDGDADFKSLVLDTELAVAEGGTGQSSYTNGQLLIGNTTGNTLTKATLTGTTNQVVVTNGAGSVTLSLPQSIATTSSVQFGKVGVGRSVQAGSGIVADFLATDAGNTTIIVTTVLESGAANSAQIRQQRARGSFGAETAILSGDRIGSNLFFGHDGSAFAQAGNFKMEAAEDWTSIAHGSRFTISTIAVGTTAVLDSVLLDSTGFLKLGSVTQMPVSRLELAEITGAVLTLSRNDTSVSAADQIGRIDFGSINGDDASLSTQSVYANIEVQSLNTVTTDAAAGKVIHRVTPTTVAGSPTEVFNYTAATLTYAEAFNLAFGTTTGTKIGTATSQKLSLWNATPIVQPTTAVAAATFVTNTSLIANDTATFDGYTIGQVVKALRNIGILA